MHGPDPVSYTHLDVYKRQLRYLINSDHGWLGGFSFSAAALKLRDRDQWIGWNTDQHRAHLHRVLGMSRFLLRTSMHCHLSLIHI